MSRITSLPFAVAFAVALIGAPMPAQSPGTWTPGAVAVEDLDAETLEALDLLVVLEELEGAGVSRDPIVGLDDVWLELPTDAETSLELILIALSELGYVVPEASPHMLGGWFAVEDVWVRVENLPFRSEPWTRLHTRIGGLADDTERERARIVLDMVNVLVDERVAAAEQAALAQQNEHQLASLPPLPAAAGIVPVDGYGVGFDDGYGQGYDQGFDEGYGQGYDGGYYDAEDRLAQVTLPGNYYAPSIISTYASWPSWIPYYSCGGGYWNYAPLACLYPRSSYGFGLKIGLGKFAFGFGSYWGPYYSPGYVYCPYPGYYYDDYAYGYGYGYKSYGFGYGYAWFNDWDDDKLVIKNVTKIKNVKKVTKIIESGDDDVGSGGDVVADGGGPKTVTPKVKDGLVRNGDVGVVDGANARGPQRPPTAIRDALASANARRTTATPKRAELVESARKRHVGSQRGDAASGARGAALADATRTIATNYGDVDRTRAVLSSGTTSTSSRSSTPTSRESDATRRVRDALSGVTVSVATGRADGAGASVTTRAVGTSSFNDPSPTRRLGRTLSGPDRSASSSAIVSSRTTTSGREPTSSSRRSFSLGTLPTSGSTYRLGRVFSSDSTSSSGSLTSSGLSSSSGLSTTTSSRGATITLGNSNGSSASSSSRSSDSSGSSLFGARSTSSYPPSSSSSRTTSTTTPSSRSIISLGSSSRSTSATSSGSSASSSRSSRSSSPSSASSSKSSRSSSKSSSKASRLSSPSSSSSSRSSKSASSSSRGSSSSPSARSSRSSSRSSSSARSSSSSSRSSSKSSSGKSSSGKRSSGGGRKGRKG